MAFVTQGNKIREFRQGGPTDGKELKSETGHSSHTEANHAAQERSKSRGKSATGFPDTPAVGEAFESLAENRKHKPKPTGKPKTDRSEPEGGN